MRLSSYWEPILSVCIIVWSSHCYSQDHKKLQRVLNAAQPITQTSLSSPLLSTPCLHLYFMQPTLSRTTHNQPFSSLQSGSRRYNRLKSCILRFHILSYLQTLEWTSYCWGQISHLPTYLIAVLVLQTKKLSLHL